MLRKKITKTLSILIAAVAVFGTSLSFANEEDLLGPEVRVTTEIGTTITGKGSLRSAPVTSGKDLTATCEVTKIDSGANFTCYVVENGKSTPVTEKKTFSSTGQHHMKYTSRPNKVQLIIKNNLVSSKYISGKFHS